MERIVDRTRVIRSLTLLHDVLSGGLALVAGFYLRLGEETWRFIATPEARNRLAVYLNDDPGSGKTLGFYMEGNASAKTIFDAWLEPLRDLGATRNIIESIGSTDHVPFNAAGLPGFNVIKDFDAYDERTRHTNVDFPDRLKDGDLQQSALVMATFAWQAAMRDGTIPRAAK